jgi:tetratricopeptide (TPR) repeat protein
VLMMKRAFALTLPFLLAGLLGGCGSSDPQRPETQRQFGVRMARMNLWREALFRFRRAAEMAPADAMAHNNLAVAYEANGDLDSAAREYREAMRLDRSNQYIQKNYARFVEFTSRNKKRQPPAPADPGGVSAPAGPPDNSAAPAAPAPTPAPPAPTPQTLGATR